MADFLENILRAARLVPEKVDADAALQELNDSLYRQQAQFDPYDLRFKQDLLVQKQNWDTAGKAIKNAENRMKAADEMLKTAGLTDEQVKQYTGAKTSAKADLLRAQAAQGQAHSDADFTRDLAKRMGYDLSKYDAYGTNLRDAALNLSADTHNAINSIIGKDMTADEYYDQAYRELLEAGAPMRQAQQEAARRAEQYRTQREAKYNTAMMMYGNNGDGTLNDIGMQLLGKIAPQSPDLVNMLLNAYAKPKDVYQNNYEAAKAQDARNDAAAMQLLGYQHEFDKLNLQNNLNKDYLTYSTNEGIRGHKAKGTFDSNNRMTEAEFKNELQKSLEKYKTDEDLRKATQMIGINIEAAGEQQKEEIRQFLVAAELAGMKPNDPTLLAAFKEKFGLTPKTGKQKEEEPDNAVMTIFAEAQTDKYADPRARIQFIDEELAKNQENGYKFKAEGVEYLRKYQDALRYIIAHKEGNAAEKNRLGKKVDLEILKNVTSNDSEAYLDAQRIQTRKKIK